jgi:hypothetical protein
MTTISKPRTFNADLAHLPAALLPLTRMKCWVIWKWEARGDRWTKPPYQPRFHNEPAKSNDPATWGTYEEAMLAFTQGLCDGIGVMLKGAGLAAIDLDHVRDFATGQVLHWAQQLFVEAANAGCYLEWTVSGTGARIIGIAHGAELHKKIAINRKTDCAVEFYRDTARYITISGLQISGDYPGLPVTSELPECDDLFDALYARFCDDEQRPAPDTCEFRGGLHIAVEEVEERPAGLPNVFDFNNAGSQTSIDYNSLIKGGAPKGERSEDPARRLAPGGTGQERGGDCRGTGRSSQWNWRQVRREAAHRSAALPRQMAKAAADQRDWRGRARPGIQAMAADPGRQRRDSAGGYGS